MTSNPTRAAGAAFLVLILAGGPALAQVSPGAAPPAPASPAAPAPQPAGVVGELTIDQIVELQSLLTAQGYDTNGVDGIVGPATEAAIRAAQEAFGLPVDGVPTLALLEQLRAAPAPVPGAPLAPAPGAPPAP